MREGIDVENQWVCIDCGNQYLKENGFEEASGVSTAHTGTCCVCNQEKVVLHERNYKWLAKWKANKKDN